ncbi:MAG: peptidylprolyl isomerase [Flavobacteriales bacterium]
MQGISIFTFSFLFSLSLFAQPGNSEFQLLDGIVAVVGDEIILNSAIEDRALQVRIEGGEVDESNKCGFLEELLFEKLLLHNARLDSLEVSDGEVMDEIERRLAYYIKMLGSVESFEAEYGKSVAQWKADFTEPILDQLLAQRMQQTISQEVRATPAEVLEYFEKTPVDSLPLIPEELSYSEIVLQPVISDRQKQAVRTTLDSIRNLVATGELSMTLAATRYSEDPGSKYKGGCYENIARGVFIPEFEAAVFDTPLNGYSPVFESDFGYHFVRVTDKRGEQFSACHVLMKPRVDPLALENQNSKIDSIYASINAGSTTFERDVLSFSTRESSKNSKGQVVNPRDGGLMFGIDELDPNLYFLLEPLEIGEMSSPVQLVDDDGDGFWTILRLEDRKAAHRANPKDDYALFQSQVENNMRALDMNEWIDEHISDTFIRLSSEYINCEFNINWKQ